jgi:signal transduction histidine kinase/ActR/RegA family two-component response regulator
LRIAVSDPQRINEILILAPEGRDAAVLRSLLDEVGISASVDADGKALFCAIETGSAAGAILTDEALTAVGLGELRAAMDRQPTWSDFPLIVLARHGGGMKSNIRGIEESLNATLLERPLHPASLVSAARSAIRARCRQRLAAEHLLQLELARQELRALASTLEDKVQERTRDLALANDRLTAEIAERERTESRLVQAQKMEAIGQLTGGLAHDFNNLLTAVVGSLDLLLRRTDDERLRRLARNALEAGQRGAELTSQLLAFSRKQRLTPAALSPNELIRRMGDLLERTIGPRVKIEARLEPHVWHALADPTQFEVMVLNLAINARDAMPDGGTLIIETSNVTVGNGNPVPDLSCGEYVAIAVSDTGTGMSREVQARAFEPFFTTKQPGQGTGLGLSQLYGFAKQSGGTVRIKSKVGEGTIVTIYLPRTNGRPGQPDSCATTSPQSGRLPVLVVDDDDAVREVCTAMLEDIGWSVVPASGGEDALAKLDGCEFAAILTDVAMPGMSGVEFAGRVRMRCPDVPILFASGYADLESFGAQLKNEIVLKKPYRLSDLGDRLAGLVDSAASMAATERAAPS